MEAKEVKSGMEVECSATGKSEYVVRADHESDGMIIIQAVDHQHLIEPDAEVVLVNDPFKGF